MSVCPVLAEQQSIFDIIRSINLKMRTEQGKNIQHWYAYLKRTRKYGMLCAHNFSTIFTPSTVSFTILNGKYKSNVDFRCRYVRRKKFDAINDTRKKISKNWESTRISEQCEKKNTKQMHSTNINENNATVCFRSKSR